MHINNNKLIFDFFKDQTTMDKNCHKYVFKIPNNYPQQVEEAMNNSYISIREKNITARGLENHQGYMFSTYYGTFLFKPSSKYCGEKYYLLNIVSQKHRDEFLNENLINSNFNEEISCIKICFMPAEWYSDIL